MKNVFNYYTDNCKAYTIQVANLKKKIHLYGTIRLLLVAALIAVIWIFKASGWQVLLGVSMLVVLPFAALMLLHARLYRKKNYFEALILLNESELKGLNYDFSAFDGGTESISSDHSFTLDLDIFGKNSLFQSINRTATFYGRQLLMRWFTEPLSDKQSILDRQAAVCELTDLCQLRQHFYVTGIAHPGKEKDKEALAALLEDKPLFLNSIFWRVMLYVVPALWVTIVGCCLLGLLSWNICGIWFALCFIIAYSRSNQINKLHHSVNKMERIFHTYADLIKLIEDHPFHSAELSDISTCLTSDSGIPASRAIRQFSKYIGALDQRGSFAGLLLNIFMLRDTRFAVLLERWKRDHAGKIGHWLNALARFDAYSSLGGFAFNHPDYTYPEIAEEYFCFEGKAMGHPLLHRDACVKNDISITGSPSFLVITGANMAGKSTYLRTIGVNYLLACIGAPVCADSLRLYPAHLVTSLRTSDSLVSNESYFFAELKRLKMIIDRLKKGEELFIILDEILKGTNSVDKQKGSLALVKQFISLRTCGIIATHDLLLGTLADEYPHEVRNYRFEADIHDNELSFSYKLRDGIAQNMNAYYLMKKMGITV